MRRLLRPAVVLASLLLAHPLAAQQTATTQARPGVMVVSYNKCALDTPAKLDSTGMLAFYPVLDELVREERLVGWGVLTHAWGGEWNFISTTRPRARPPSTPRGARPCGA